MRLISTADLTLHTFPDNAIPRYSILSHTWGDEEVLFHEMLKPTEEIRGRSGYKKIQRCAEISREVWNCGFTWVDTCCIDKTSSSELSESINSMYVWYRDAYICFAYLEDFHGEHICDVLQETRWFNRGWTLQELLAPEEVIFYSASWKRIGNKKWHLPSLESITGIDESILMMNTFQDVSVAEKMKWAANRKTTKKEDLAYCMMGIFDVSMPLLYGEGDKAFTRLQEEIMRNSDDVTIFLWKSTNENPSAYRGALARHPIEFALSTAPKAPMCVLDEPYRMTNKGLQITVALTGLDRVASKDLIFLAEDPDHSSLFLLSFDQRDTHQRVTTHHIVLRKIKAAKQHFVRAYPGFQFIAARKPLATEPRSSRTGEETIMVVGRLSLSDVDWVLPCRGFNITEVMYKTTKVAYMHEEGCGNRIGSARELAPKFESKLMKTTSSADKGVLEAMYHSNFVGWPGREIEYKIPTSQHILLRYEQQHGRLHLLIFYDLRTEVFQTDDVVSIDTLLQAVRTRRYPSEPSSDASEKLAFFAGMADMRRKPEIYGDTATSQVTAKFKWTISDDSVFLNVYIDHEAKRRKPSSPPYARLQSPPRCRPVSFPPKKKGRKQEKQV
ncbi:het and ankyrin domain protein [Colletotrichum karsti]|uniref:Het and ankyrin domain protein n=1 Tax=Colletotrichum karsti TaxID=1095194 RepID=A0A9P6I0U3_9PEZI|nr:het and ankyrin domain protein [Colletotrichum karsti]KAF9872801.1 het and ankyrin domain protein [Colletotrichum karsti]